MTKEGCKEHKIPLIADKNSKVLLLCSFPPENSHSYHQDGRNRFWEILEMLFVEKGLKGDIQAQKDFLIRRNIALWDIFKTCKRNGPKETDIQDGEPNDLSVVFEQADIKQIFIVGKGIYKDWACKFYPQYKDIMRPLTSSSGYTRLNVSDDEICKEWEQIKEFLQ